MYYANPHFAKYRKGYHAVDLEGNVVFGPQTVKVHEMPVHLKHYFTKSLEEFEIKRMKGKADTSGLRAKKEFFERDYNDVYDDSMLGYAEIIKEKESNERIVY